MNNTMFFRKCNREKVLLYSLTRVFARRIVRVAASATVVVMVLEVVVVKVKSIDANIEGRWVRASFIYV